MSFIDNGVHPKAILNAIIPYPLTHTKKQVANMDIRDTENLLYDAKDKFSECK